MAPWTQDVFAKLGLIGHGLFILCFCLAYVLAMLSGWPIGQPAADTPGMIQFYAVFGAVLAPIWAAVFCILYRDPVKKQQ